MMQRRSIEWLTAVLLVPTASWANNFPVPLISPRGVVWHEDYHAGLDEAQSRRKLALVWFFDPSAASENERFEHEVLARSQIAALIDQHCVATRLEIRGSVLSGGEQVVLIDHPAFAEMLHSPGLALVDMTDETSSHFRQVVSVYPFKHGAISAEKLAVLLDLPRGSLTQRTLIFAVRTHPEHPASTTG